jgi:glutaredoxin
LLSDFWPHGGVASLYGVLRDDGASERAIFIMDEAGIIRYIDIHDFDDQPDNEVLLAELAKLNPDGAAKVDAQENETKEALPEEGVVLYCTRYCPACVKARKWFEDHQIDYTEVNVSTNAEAVRQVKEWADGNRTTPTINIHGTIVVGWDEEEVSKLLLSNR